MSTLLIMEFLSAIAGRGVYPLGSNGDHLDFSTGTVRPMDITDTNNDFGDGQQTNVTDQTLTSDFTYSGGTISAGTVITSAGQTQLVSADGTSVIKVGYVRLGAWPDVKQLLIIEVVSGSFDPAATYFSSASTDANGGFTYQSYPCFLRQTKILTLFGDVAVEHLKVGDLVLTQDHGLQPIRWIGSRMISQQVALVFPNLMPVRIKSGAFGAMLPHADLLLSPQHRVLVRSKIVAKMAGHSEALVAIKHLVEMDGIEQIACEDMDVDYFHILFDHHEVISANGLPTESLFAGAQALQSIGEKSRNEIFALYPDLGRNRGPIAPPARVFLSGSQGLTLVARCLKNGKRLLDYGPNVLKLSTGNPEYART